MRVLLIAPSRSASKWVFRNLMSYYEREALLPIFHDLVGKTELIYQEGKIVPIETDKIHSFSSGLVNLMEVLRLKGDGYLTRVHPIKFESGSLEHERLEEVIGLHDKTLQLINENHFERSVSRLICNITGVWVPGKEQETLRANYLNQPIEADLKRFKCILESNDFDCWVSENASITLPFKTYSQIKNAQEFCLMFGLPKRDFAFIPAEFEYGDKRQYFTNYEQLKDLYNEYVSGIDRADLIIA